MILLVIIVILFVHTLINRAVVKTSYIIPTESPTLSPTTTQPSTMPTLSIPTSHPSTTPTISIPTTTPTISIPTTMPTTSQPSTTPTISIPTTVPTTSQPSSMPTTSQPSSMPTTSQPSSMPATSAPTRPEPVFAGYQLVCGIVDDGAVAYNSQTGWNAIVEACNHHVKQNQDESWNKVYPFVHHPTNFNNYQALFFNYFNPNPISTNYYNHEGDIIATHISQFFNVNNNPNPGIFRTSGNTFNLPADGWVGPGPVESIDAPSGPIASCQNWNFPGTNIATGMYSGGGIGTNANGFLDSNWFAPSCTQSVWNAASVRTNFPGQFNEFCDRQHPYMCFVEVFSYNGQVKLHSRR